MPEEKHYETPKVLHDAPIEDQRTDFHFEEYAITLARLIADKTTDTPLAIGINGSWGSGKTTLLKRVQAMLEPTHVLNDPSQPAVFEFVNPDENPQGQYRVCRTVWFNAWKYADENELLVALVRVIVQAMYADDFIAKSSAAILDPLKDRRDVIETVLGWFAITAPYGNVITNLLKPKPTKLAEKTAILDLFNAAFDRLLAAWVHRSVKVTRIDPEEGVLVVFIDDLDRCLPQKTVQILEAVKLFLDKKGCIFVLGADTEVVRAAVQSHYENVKVEDENADKYLEKVIQLQFELPPIVLDTMEKFLEDQENVDPVMRGMWQTLVEAAEINPRRVKSVINDVNLLWTMFKNSDERAASVDRADFIRWQAVNHAAPDDFKKRVHDMDPELRFNFVMDAVRWGKGEGDETVNSVFQEYEKYSRLRRALRNVDFSDGFRAEALDAFIHLTAPAEKQQARQESVSEKSVKQPEEKVEEVTLEPETASVGTFAEKAKFRGEPVRGGDTPPARQGARTFAGMEFMPIPAGKFIMGSKDDDKDAYDDEKPQHTLDIPYEYFMARFPVSNVQYNEFFTATGGEHPVSGWEKKQDHPVVSVSWEDAQKFIAWLNEIKKSDLPENHIYCLPSEAEWEKAARGTYGNIYPWGNDWDAKRCNSEEAKIGGTSPVMLFSPVGDSPYGVADMSGNIWEWTRSLFKSYEYKPGDGREDGKAGGSRVLRGGSFSDNRRNLRCAFRVNLDPVIRNRSIGFRVCISPAQRP